VNQVQINGIAEKIWNYKTSLNETIGGFGKILNSISSELELKVYKVLKDSRNWEDRMSSGNFNVAKTKELKKILKRLEFKFPDVKSQNYDDQNIINLIESYDISKNNKIIKFGYFENQDSILPYFFKYSYKRSLNTEFSKLTDWERGLDYVLDNTIDVTIADFSKILAFNLLEKNNNDKLFFFPLFTYNGYYIRVKRSLKFNNKEFDSLSNTEKKETLESKDFKIVLEKNTDGHWAFIKFCEKLKCNLNVINKKIEDKNVNKATDFFLKNENAKFISTNPLNNLIIRENSKSAKNESTIIKGLKNLLNHQNYNGLICKMSFYEKNKESIARIISTWFNDINLINKEINLSADGEDNFETCSDIASFYNVQLKTGKFKFSPKQIHEILSKSNNRFFSKNKYAIEEFKEVFNENNQTYHNNIEIALKQLKNSSINLKEAKSKLSTYYKGLREVLGI